MQIDLWHVRPQKRHVIERDFRIKTNMPSQWSKPTLSTAKVRMKSTLLIIFVSFATQEVTEALLDACLLKLKCAENQIKAADKVC